MLSLASFWPRRGSQCDNNELMSVGPNWPVIRGFGVIDIGLTPTHHPASSLALAFLTASITHRLEQFEGRMDQRESNDV